MQTCNIKKNKCFLILYVLFEIIIFNIISACSENFLDEKGDITPKLIRWSKDRNKELLTFRKEGGAITNHLDLTKIYGEREYTRNAQWIDINGDGQQEIVLRTMNENRLRIINGKTGKTIHISPQLISPNSHSPISDMAVGDIDEDGNPDATIATYHGDVICIDLCNGNIKWHRELPYYINNPRLDYRNITEGRGKNLVLTVGNDVEWISLHSRSRINFVRHPNLIVLNGDGTTEWMVKDYDTNNGNGHNTWAYDIDGDNLCEVIVSGKNKLVVFSNTGRHLFNLPISKGEHADEVIVYDLTDNHFGKEIIYLNGANAITIADNEGNILKSKNLPPHLQSHLQDIAILKISNGIRLVAQNIRSKDSRLIFLDKNLNILWTAKLSTGVNMLGATPGYNNFIYTDWNNDKEKDISIGSHGGTSFQVLDSHGRPLYLHQWNLPEFKSTMPQIVSLLDIKDIDNDGFIEQLIGMGNAGGPEGRFSLAEGSNMHLYVLDPKKIKKN